MPLPLDNDTPLIHIETHDPMEEPDNDTPNLQIDVKIDSIKKDRANIPTSRLPYFLLKLFNQKKVVCQSQTALGHPIDSWNPKSQDLTITRLF